jgi:lipopolysaccharide export system permease protein
MTTLDRYLLREILVPFLVGLGLFFVVIAFAQVLKISDSVTGLGVGGGEILQALMYSFPPLMGLLIPVSGLFATLLGVGRLAADREVVAMSAGGVSPYVLLRVPLAFGGVLAVLSAFALVEGEPWGINGLKELMSRSAQKTLAEGVRVGEFNEWVTDVMFYARGKEGGELTGVMFADRRKLGSPIVVSAERSTVAAGKDAGDIVFDLVDGSVLLYDDGSRSQRLLRFERGRYRLEVGKLVQNKFRTASLAQAKTVQELAHDIDDPATPDNKRALFTVVLHRKLALPLATLIFAALAVPLACRRTGGARARGFLYSAGIVGAYYYIGRAAELSARAGRFPPELAAWVPNAIGVVALAILLIRLKRQAA